MDQAPQWQPSPLFLPARAMNNTEHRPPQHLFNTPDSIRVGEGRYIISYSVTTDHLGNDYRKLAIAWGAPPMKAFEGKQGWRGWRVVAD